MDRGNRPEKDTVGKKPFSVSDCFQSSCLINVGEDFSGRFLPGYHVASYCSVFSLFWSCIEFLFCKFLRSCASSPTVLFLYNISVPVFLSVYTFSSIFLYLLLLCLVVYDRLLEAFFFYYGCLFLGIYSCAVAYPFHFHFC